MLDHLSMGHKTSVSLRQKDNLAHKLTLSAVIAIGFFLRLAYLFQPIRYDEAVNQIAFYSQPLSKGLSFYPYPSNHLLNTLLSHVTTRVAGSSVWAMRLPAFVAGVLIIPLLYLVIRQLVNKNAALLAAGLAAVSVQLASYSTQSRGYSLQVLIFLAMILVAASVIKNNKPMGWVALAVLGALGFYALPTMLYYYPPVILWVVLSRIRRPFTKQLLLRASITVVGTAAVVFLLYLPVILSSGASSLFLNKYVKPLVWSAFVHGTLQNLREMFMSWNLGLPWVICALLFVGLLIAVIFYHSMSRVGTNLPLIICAWSTALYLGQRVLPFPKVFIGFLALYLGLAAAGLYFGLSRVFSRVRRLQEVGQLNPIVWHLLLLAMVALLCAMVIVPQFLYQTDELGWSISTSTMRDAQKISLAMKSQLRKGDMVYVLPGYGTQFLQYYFSRQGTPVDYLFTRIAMKDDKDLIAKDPRNNELVVRNLTPNSEIKRAFLVLAPREGQTEGKFMQFIVYDAALDLKNFGDRVTLLETDYSAAVRLSRERAGPTTTSSSR